MLDLLTILMKKVIAGAESSNKSDNDYVSSHGHLDRTPNSSRREPKLKIIDNNRTLEGSLIKPAPAVHVVFTVSFGTPSIRLIYNASIRI